MGKVVYEVQEHSCETFDEAANKLQTWRDFYSPTYGWKITDISINEKDGRFIAYIKVQK